MCDTNTNRLLIISLVVLLIIMVLMYEKEYVLSENLTSAVEQPIFWRGNAAVYRDVGDILDAEGTKDFNDAKSEQTEEENQYIESLPWDEETESKKVKKNRRKCRDRYNRCKQWAANGECLINPEYMLYNCARSCRACRLNPQQKYNVTRIMNRRDPSKCVYHGAEYPNNLGFLEKLYNSS